MSHHPFSSSQVQAVFDAYPQRMRGALMNLRGLVLGAGGGMDGTGGIVETLKWGEPAYLPIRARVGTTVRLGPFSKSESTFAMFVNCQTWLAQQFRDAYPGQLRIDGERAILFEVGEALPRAIIRHCAALAFSYHARKI